MPSGVRSLEAGRDLLLEAGDPHLEELVEVAAEDAEELEPLEQRRPGVERLVQHAAVELEPGELAIDVERRVPEVEVEQGRGRSWRSVTGGMYPAAMHRHDASCNRVYRGSFSRSSGMQQREDQC